MILSFGNDTAKLIWEGVQSKKIQLPPSLHDIARKKLRILAAAPSLTSLKIPPNNHLEKLQRDRTGQWSIRINDQYRICFKWNDGNAYDVEIVDYH